MPALPSLLIWRFFVGAHRRRWARERERGDEHLLVRHSVRRDWTNRCKLRAPGKWCRQKVYREEAEIKRNNILREMYVLMKFSSIFVEAGCGGGTGVWEVKWSSERESNAVVKYLFHARRRNARLTRLPFYRIHFSFLEIAPLCRFNVCVILLILRSKRIA